jgi:hypothetical protein
MRVKMLSIEFVLLTGVCSGKRVSESCRGEGSTTQTSGVDKVAEKVADPLKRDVDPRLLVSYKCKGPAVSDTQPPKDMISVLNSIFIEVLGESMLSVCPHIHSVQKQSAFQLNPLEFQEGKGKRSRSPSPAGEPPQLPRRQCS